MGVCLERFLAKTGKCEQAYKVYATQVGQRMHINALDKIICEKSGVYSVAHLAMKPTSLPLGISESEVVEYILNHSENAYEIAQIWKECKQNAEQWHCKESAIAAMLMCFPRSDFERFGDRNRLIDVSKRWFDEQGINIDVQAMVITENVGFEIEIQDIIDFVMTWRPSRYINPAQLLVRRIEARWFELVGFRIKDYYVEHLTKMCCFESVEREYCPF